MNISGDFYPIVISESRAIQWSFIPKELTSIVACFKMDVELTHLLTRTHRLLGILEGTLGNLPDIEPFLKMGLIGEAQKSCAVDGIMAYVQGMLLDSKQTEDDLAAVNYYNALKCLEKTAVTTEALCEMQETVMKGITERQCGKIRATAFLMHPQYTSNGPEYNPPPPDLLPGMLEDLEKFIQTESSVDVLIKLAMAYYQFETIHPFECGNGRVGRILIILMLMNEGILGYPFLSLSGYFLEQKDECFRQFIMIQHYGQFGEWIRFFINGVAASAEKTIWQIEQAKGLRQMAIQSIQSYEKPTETLLRLYSFIEINPIISVDEAAKGLRGVL